MMKRTGPISGLVVFFLGIGLMVFTFFVAYSGYINPERLVAFTKLVPVPEPGVGAGTEALVAGLVGGLVGGLVKVVGYLVALGLLVVMMMVGGRITGHGIKMFRTRPSEDSDKDA